MRAANGAQRPPKPNGADKPNARANAAIEAAKRGQRAAKTLSGGQGSRGAEDLSLNDLSDLYAEDPEEFDSMWDKMARAGKLG